MSDPGAFITIEGGEGAIPKTGAFITFEGGEGAGKTTLINSLKEALIELGYAVVTTREPGGSSFGEQIRQMLLHQTIPIAPMAELMLFLADRSQHIEEVIKPSLSTGAVVLCDRFTDSSIAYQGVGRGLGLEKVQKLCQLITAGVVPDLTIFLDIDPQVGLTRVKKQRAQDRMEVEKAAFHEKVRQGFLTLANKEKQRIVVLDGSQAPEEVFKAAIKHIEAILK